MPGSLRLRITLLATLALGTVLAVGSLVLVWAVERTVVGEVRDAAGREVDRVADALTADEDLEPAGESLNRHTVLVLIRDNTGRTVDILVTGIPDSQLQHLAESGRLDQLAPHVDAVEAAEGLGLHVESGQSEDDLVVASRRVATPEGPRTVVAVSNLAPATQSVDATIRALLVSAPLLLFFVAGLTWVVTGRALRPVEQIRDQADTISHSNLGDRLPEAASRDELGRLTTTLNEMLERLEAGAWRQREFISDASHELATPLAAIRAELEIALAHPERADWPGVAERLLSDHRRLERLTADLLTLARLDEPLPDAGTDVVNLAEVVAIELESSSLEVEADLKSVQVLGSASYLARLVHNLIDNANRYGNYRIAVQLSEEDGVAVLTVDDDGAGVPEADRDRIFDRFTRLDESRARSSGGVGIGLSLVRRVADWHGGSVSVGDAAMGGARFEVRIPLT